MLDQPILEVRNLSKVFPVEGGRRLVAVDGIDLEIRAGETLALVGESGSGKSTVARCIVRLVEPTGGDVVIAGSSILGLQPSRLAGVYRHVQMVFQDPNASLNPRMSVRQV
ncbi:MAG: ATP-binding cassette domain-containing protein, partial [Reyranella sp.]|nr:ATP-binding cassette domain-containing protein [Reyranella sp.]